MATSVIELSATLRDRAGKGAARETRREGRVPAVIYGGKEPPVMISLEFFELKKQVYRPGFMSHLISLTIDGKTHRVLARDVQLDPIKDTPIHLDFLRVGRNTQIAVAVPVNFINEAASPGLKRGAVLNVVRHEVEVTCPASDIPEEITVDLTGYDVNTSIHISAVSLPEGVAPTITDRDFTIATISAPSGLKSEANAEEAGEEG